MDLNEINVFLKVAQAGSFTRAARQLGIPNSTASARVSALERRLGVTLLQRTTRKLHLTEDGEAYFQQASQGLEEILKAEAAISASQREPQGLLRVTAPIDLGSNCLADLISAFTKKYPAVNVELIFTSRYVDLVAEGVDVAVRAGKLRDSGLIARKVGLTNWIPIASPAYLKKAGTPLHPKELRHHACLQFTPLGTDDWQLSDGKHTVSVPLARNLVVNEINFAKALALAGNGIALLPSYICHAEIRSAKLIRILPEWRGRVDPVHLVYPGQKFVAPKLRAFVDMASGVLKRVFEE
jgi:DNA-binding transcriptional LysR family regulator